MLVAITSKNQRQVNKAVKFLTAYNQWNDAREKADNEGDSKAFKVADRKCETSWERYHEATSQLPKREVKAIEKAYY